MKDKKVLTKAETKAYKQFLAKQKENLKTLPKKEKSDKPILNPNSYLSLNKDYSILIKLGNLAEDTLVKTKSGEIINFVKSLSLDIDAESQIPLLHLTIYNPRVIGNNANN